MPRPPFLSTLAALAIPAVFLVAPSTAHADEGAEGVAAKPHRIHAPVGAGATLSGFDDDGHWPEGGLGIGFGAGYAYAALPWLELGAGATYFLLPSQFDSHQSVLLPGSPFVRTWTSVTPSSSASRFAAAPPFTS